MESCMRISFIEASFILYCLTQGTLNILGTLKLRKGPAAATPSKKAYTPATIQTAAFAAIALLTAEIRDLPVWGSSRIDARSVLLGLALLVLTISIEPLEQKFTAAEIRRRIGSFLPQTARERFSWVFVCIVVGIGEEIIFRAVLFGIFLRLTGNYWMAATASAAFFFARPLFPRHARHGRHLLHSTLSPVAGKDFRRPLPRYRRAFSAQSYLWHPLGDSAQSGEISLQRYTAGPARSKRS